MKPGNVAESLLFVIGKSIRDARNDTELLEPNFHAAEIERDLKTDLSAAQP
jgi:hypothetical protein